MHTKGNEEPNLLIEAKMFCVINHDVRSETVKIRI